MNSKHYDSDLTEAEFAILEPLLPARKARGRPRSVALRELLDAIFYVLRGGVPWRMVPEGFPPWKTVFHYFRQWRLSGLWEAINAALRERVREGVGRTAQPSASIIDSQPFGIINLEAMACETAVVASAVGGIKEVVVPGETGLLVDLKLQPGTFDPVDPARFAHDLATAINTVAGDEALRTRFGRNGRHRVEEH